MSLKTLISVSGRLTGDPSSCQKDFYFIFKGSSEQAFSTFYFIYFLCRFQLDLNTIKMKVEMRDAARLRAKHRCFNDKEEAELPLLTCP